MNGLRWFTMFVGLLDIGTLIACYERAWKFAPPTWAIRSAISGAIGVSGLAIYGVVQRIDAPTVNWQTPTALGCFLAYLSGLIGYYAWTRTVEGRRYRHDLIGDHATRRLTREAARRDQARARANKLRNPKDTE